MPDNQDKQIKSNNLKVIEDQISYEALMNKKCHEYAMACGDTQLKDLCNEAAKIHKDNFNSLKTYLDSHQ